MRHSGGLDGVAAFLLLLFVILKLTGLVSWSWWWLAIIFTANGVIAFVTFYVRNKRIDAQVLNVETGDVTTRKIRVPVETYKILHAEDGGFYALDVQLNSKKTIVPVKKAGWSRLRNGDYTQQQRADEAELVLDETDRAIKWYFTSMELGLNGKGGSND